MKDRDEFLENEFDFSKAIKNPYTKASKKQITINLDEEVILFFKNKAENTGIPYQTLIKLSVHLTFLFNIFRAMRYPNIPSVFFQLINFLN